MDMAAAGAVLHGHAIQEKLRDGGTSVLWKALDPRQQPIALKQLTAEAFADRRTLRAFRRGGKFLKGLSHKHLLKVHDTVDAGAPPFCTMELFVSDHLKHTVSRFPGRIFKKEFGILRKVAEALGHLHENGLVHGDLRPENVLIAPTSEVRLAGLDFAATRFERLLHLGPKPVALLQYGAPEGRRGDFRSDFYSFGILMYELLTQQLPFTELTDKGILEKQLNDYPYPMRTLIPTLAPEIDSFLWRLIARKPADRFASINDVLTGLLKFEWAETQVRVRQTRRLEPPPPLKLA